MWDLVRGTSSLLNWIVFWSRVRVKLFLQSLNSQSLGNQNNKNIFLEMYIIVKSNTHPLIGNYYFKKTRESVTLKSKMEKWLLLLLHVLHGDDSHHFLLDVGDLWVDLTNHVIHSSLAEEMRVFMMKIISITLQAGAASKRIRGASNQPDCFCKQEAEWRTQPRSGWSGSSYWTLN